MSRILGIDLGTTNSVAAYMTKGVATPIGFTANDQIFPSIVSIERNGKFEVGTKAKNSQRNKIYSAKRFIGRRFADDEVQQALSTMDLPYEVTEGADGDVRLSVDGREFSPIEIGALVLRKIKETAEAQHGEFPRAIITVPAYFRESQVAATREAGRLAGFHVVQTINEPTAAALAFGAVNAAEAEGKVILIYDFGGGTFDVSLLMPVAGSYTVLEVGGDAFLGGDNIDNLLMRRVHDATLKEHGVDIYTGPDAARAKRTLKAEVEKAKIGLSTSFEEAIDLPALNGANVYYTFRRDDLEQMIATLVERSIELTLEVLNNKGFSPGDVEMVLLVGGTTQIPLIRRRLAETFGEQKLQTNINPMLCVAEGAAVLSATINTVDCVSCMTSNDIESTKCGQCGASLIGSGNPIGDLMGDRLSAPLPIAKNFEKASGLKCMECGNVCPPGAKICPKCNADLAVKETIDITAHPIGIELVDGSFAKIINAGTHFPMNENRAETFRTAMDNQPRLEVNVFEGSKNTAAENEFLGSIDIPLLTSYPKGTPIEVALKLDRSRTTEVSVRVGGRNEAPQSFRLQRSVLLPEIKDSVVATRRDTFAFLDRWKDETVPAEQIALKEHIGTLDGFLSGNTAVGKSKQDIETQLKAGKDLLEICTSARGTCAALSNVIHGLDGIAPQDQLRMLNGIYDELMQARTHGRWEALPQIVERADDAMEKVGNWRAMLLAENLLAQGLFSPTVASRVQNSVETIRRGVANNNRGQIDSGFNSLDAVWPEMNRELENNRNNNLPQVRPDR
jgi:molecular chaperone DnaK (HSP70)